MWMLRGFEFRLSLSLSLSVGVLVRRPSSAFFWSAPLSGNLSFISFISSDRIRLGFLDFLLRRSRIDRKITFNYFYSFIYLFIYLLTNFIDISLCADPMRRKNPFSILNKVSAPITSGECSRGGSLQSLFCVCDKLERDLFRSDDNCIFVFGNIPRSRPCTIELSQTIMISSYQNSLHQIELIAQSCLTITIYSIVHCSWKVFLTTSSVRTNLYRSPC